MRIKQYENTSRLLQSKTWGDLTLYIRKKMDAAWLIVNMLLLTYQVNSTWWLSIPILWINERFVLLKSIKKDFGTNFSRAYLRATTKCLI